MQNNEINYDYWKHLVIRMTDDLMWRAVELLYSKSNWCYQKLTPQSIICKIVNKDGNRNKNQHDMKKMCKESTKKSGIIIVTFTDHISAFCVAKTASTCTSLSRIMDIWYHNQSTVDGLS